MQAQVKQWGNSQGIRLPKEVLRSARIDVTDFVHYSKNTETCTPVYTEYHEDYEKFYKATLHDVEAAKRTGEYGLDMENHPNWFDASYISWLSYDALNIELPDGYLFFAPSKLLVS